MSVQNVMTIYQVVEIVYLDISGAASEITTVPSLGHLSFSMAETKPKIPLRIWKALNDVAH